MSDASRAVATTSSTKASSGTGTVALTSPVAGLNTGDVPSAETRSPLTKCGIEVMRRTFPFSKSTGRVEWSRRVGL